MTRETFAIRVRHPDYGLGWFRHVLPEAGHACAEFDGTDRFAAGRRRVLSRDLTPLTLQERAAETDRQISEMMGHDVRAVVPALRLVTP